MVVGRYISVTADRRGAATSGAGVAGSGLVDIGTKDTVPAMWEQKRKLMGYPQLQRLLQYDVRLRLFSKFSLLNLVEFLEACRLNSVRKGYLPAWITGPS